MKFLVVGHGAREHAIARRLNREGNSVSSFRIKSNIGLGAVCCQSSIRPEYDVASILRFAKECKVDAIIVGHEEPIFRGIADEARKARIPCYAPLLAAAKLESDKLYAKRIVAEVSPSLLPRAHVATSRADAVEYARHLHPPFVIKNPIHGDEQATQVILDIKRDRLDYWLEKYISQSGVVLFEEYIRGHDFFVYCFTDGKRFLFPKVVKDYPFKRNSNRGEKTGGMGSVSTAGILPFMTRSDFRTACACIRSSLKHLKHFYGVEYRGIIVGQFIKSRKGIFFLEFDARPGDSETINVLESISTKLTNIVCSTLRGKLVRIRTNRQSVVCIYHVPPGYPRSSRPIVYKLPSKLLNSNSIFFSDTSFDLDGNILTGSSRTFVVVGKGCNLHNAREDALQRSRDLPVGLSYRDDIGSCW